MQRTRWAIAIGNSLVQSSIDLPYQECRKVAKRMSRASDIYRAVRIAYNVDSMRDDIIDATRAPAHNGD